MTDERDAIAKDDHLQVDPEMHEGPAGFGRIAMTLVGAAVIIGLVFFGLAQHRAERESTASGSPSSSAPPAAAQNTAPTTSNPADQPASSARGPSNAEQARKGAGGNTGQAPKTNGSTGQAPANPAASSSGTAPSGTGSAGQNR